MKGCSWRNAEIATGYDVDGIRRPRLFTIDSPINVAIGGLDPTQHELLQIVAPLPRAVQVINRIPIIISPCPSVVHMYPIGSILHVAVTDQGMRVYTIMYGAGGIRGELGLDSRKPGGRIQVVAPILLRYYISVSEILRIDTNAVSC